MSGEIPSQTSAVESLSARLDEETSFLSGGFERIESFQKLVLLGESTFGLNAHWQTQAQP